MKEKIPDRLTFKKKEVIQITKLDGRVLDFWEKEFKVIKPMVNQSGEKFYTRHDLEMIFKIRQLLVVEKKKKDEVRRALVQEVNEVAGDKPDSPQKPIAKKAIRHIRDGLKEILTLLDKNDKK